jgi:hypothetical protein
MLLARVLGLASPDRLGHLGPPVRRAGVCSSSSLLQLGLLSGRPSIRRRPGSRGCGRGAFPRRRSRWGLRSSSSGGGGALGLLGGRRDCGSRGLRDGAPLLARSRGSNHHHFLLSLFLFIIVVIVVVVVVVIVIVIFILLALLPVLPEFILILSQLVVVVVVVGSEVRGVQPAEELFTLARELLSCELALWGGKLVGRSRVGEVNWCRGQACLKGLGLWCSRRPLEELFTLTRQLLSCDLALAGGVGRVGVAATLVLVGA